MISIKSRSAFTIVELLIVIVVIGILAAVIIVSYIGITQSASSSQTKANATEVAKALSVYKVRNSNGETYPLGTNNGGTISALQTTGTNQPNIPTNINITSYLTDPNGKNYCATVQSSDGNTSYSVSSTSPSPMNGVCVENLAVNPSFEGGITPWYIYAAGSVTWILASDTYSGSSSAQVNVSVANHYGLFTSSANNNSGSAMVYTLSGYFKATSGTPMRLDLQDYNSSNVYVTTTNVTANATGSWQRLVVSASLPNGDKPNLGLDSNSSTGAITFLTDAVMLTAAPSKIVYSYADGNSAGWFWTGTPNNSTSIGPAVAQ